MDDLIVQEIREYRAEHAAGYGNDLARICDALREQEQASGREAVSKVHDKAVERGIEA